MADFCNQCAEELGFEPGDMAGLCKPGQVVTVLCEDCGPNYVDHEGNCRGPCAKQEHWDEVAKRPC